LGSLKKKKATSKGFYEARGTDEKLRGVISVTEKERWWGHYLGEGEKAAKHIKKKSTTGE